MEGYFINSFTDIITPEISNTLFAISKNYKNIHTKLSEQHIVALGRRFSMIADAYVPISQIFYREPSSEEECREINIYLNSLYINIFGSLENLAWLIYFEKIYQNEKVNKMQISLFSNVYISICEKNNISIACIKKENYKWYLELKKKRDPIAHQIPLYIPYRVVTTKDELQEFKELERQGKEKIEHNDTHGWYECLYKSRKVGKFIPKIWLVDSEQETLSFIEFSNLINNDIRRLSSIVLCIIEALFSK